MSPLQQHELLSNYNNIGIVFIGPIIGLPPSLMSTFSMLKEYGVDIEGVDIWENQDLKKNLWNILRLTILPGSHKKRIHFANNFNEKKLFELILKKIDILKNKGKGKIILGGMSGGFIFASRIIEKPLTDEIPQYAHKIQPLIKGLFGISPLIFYPLEVTKKSANLELIPKNIPTILIWGDNDIIIPKGTITLGEEISRKNTAIKSIIIHGPEVGMKNQSIKHQFFGGKDFIKPFSNIFWNEKAEKIASNHLNNLIKKINAEN